MLRENSLLLVSVYYTIPNKDVNVVLNFNRPNRANPVPNRIGGKSEFMGWKRRFLGFGRLIELKEKKS